MRTVELIYLMIRVAMNKLMKKLIVILFIYKLFFIQDKME